MTADTGRHSGGHACRHGDAAELLARAHLDVDMEVPAPYISGSRVLITGAGGSIGRELSRQVALRGPSELVLLGRGENSVYEIEQDLIQSGMPAPAAIIADIRDRAAMAAVFDRHRPQIVFHAAAHKHVPLMERHPIEAFCCNVLGTLNVAELSAERSASPFVFVSTDKAVRPGGVMGATKRIGEFVVGALAGSTDADFGIARFGNVLGSRGSLLPALESQIRRGGPIRLTSPEMTRYFMTIPEAVQLIIHAGSIAREGEVFILDMGRPVSVAALVDALIERHGLVKGSSIEVQYVGIRPGEKLHEDLVYEGEELMETSHPKIHMVKNDVPFEWSSLRAAVMEVARKCRQQDAEWVRDAVMELSWTGARRPARTVAA